VRCEAQSIIQSVRPDRANLKYLCHYAGHYLRVLDILFHYGGSMRKDLAFRLSLLMVLITVCGLSALGSPTFSVTHGPVRDVIIDSTKSIVVQSAVGVMPIPEPASLVLLGTGVLALFGKKIRRRLHK
jgi:hypothetical protein